MKFDIRKFAFPMEIVNAQYLDILNTETMELVNCKKKFNMLEWVVPNIDEPLANAYNIAAIEVFDSDNDQICYPGFKLARNLGHNAIYPHMYYREIE